MDGGVGTTRRYAYVDSSALKPSARVSFAKAICIQDEEPLYGNYILLATWEYGVLVPNGLIEPIFIKNIKSKIRNTNYVVEVGGISDASAKPLERLDRMRCSEIQRISILRAVLTKPAGNIDLWIQCLDESGKIVNTIGNLWTGTTKPIDVFSLDSAITSFNFVFKRTDDGDVSADDLNSASKYVSDVLTNYSYYRDFNVKYNVVSHPIRIVKSKLYIETNGFGIEYLHGGTYWVADASRERQSPYVFDFGAMPSSSTYYLVLDSTKLVNAGARTELSDAVSIKTLPVQSDIIIAYYYASDGKIVLRGQFNTLFAEKPNYNNEVLFAPEFYAFKHGRRNRENGTGIGWYERFRIVHTSDIHTSWSAMREAIFVANDKVNLFINTGDDSNGTTSSDADVVKKDLTTSAGYAKALCTIPYVQVSGNHDVTGLTKKEYFDIICSTVEQLSKDVVWGDAENYRTYGYIDFKDTSYEGNFRIIMLDPCDYNDGEFETVYPFMSVVFSQKQIDWLIDTLLDAATNGLNVITAMHYSFGDAAYSTETMAYPDVLYCQDTFMIPDIIDAIQNKTALDRSYSDKNGDNDIIIDRDFSSATELNFVAHLFGHIHSKNHYQCQKADGSKKYDMLMLGEAALTALGTGLNKAYRERGTINGLAFSALEIDVVEKAVYRVAYGAYLNYDKSNSERTVKIPYRFDN